MPDEQDIDKKLNAIWQYVHATWDLCTRIMEGVQKVSIAVDALASQVSATLAVEAAAVQTIQTLANELAASAGDTAKVTALTAQLKTSADALGAAVTAVPPPSPAPPP